MRESGAKGADRFQPDKMLRKRKNRRYNETNDEEGDGERKFDLQEQIKAERFEQIREKHLQQLPGDAITLSLIQRHGFERPILVVEPQGLNLRVPPKSFLIRDVRNCVGPDRIIDVMDVKTQKNIEMSMKDWCKYYESKSRDRLLNVISLEFSHTKLDELVESPMIVKLLDWVDLVWPKFLKQSQTESTNSMNKMKYPKVQKYCLMSVKGSYTDFHIDFGGTSVWYHILKGRKIFWMVPPTDLNLQIFEEWTLSGMQQDVFFGDTVEECFRVELCAGNTFFIPSGWIHAVYTLEDSLVFGGNFLHSFGIENQLRVAKIEDATKVPVKFRFPFYTEILWYTVQHYVYSLSGKDHLHRHDSHTATTPPKSSKLESQYTSPSSVPEKQVMKEAIKSNNRNNEIDDDSTESEYDEEGNNLVCPKNKSASANKRKGAASSAKTSKVVSKKAKKKPAETDDESTDIDSGSEELARLTAEKPNTCRMTKNSLLRLQYEVDEEPKSPIKKTTKSTSSKSAANNSNKSNSTTSGTKSSTDVKPEATSLTIAEPNQHETQVLSTSSNSINFADILNETKLNGWSGGGGGQSIWTNPNQTPTEPTKIHITKYEVTGLKVLVKHLSKLSGAKKNLPALIRNSRALLDDCKKLINEHENDDPELAITGKPITPDLLKSKKADMNDLIGQFFKSTGNLETDRDSISLSSNTATSNISPKLKSESSSGKLKQVNSANELAATLKVGLGEEENGSFGNANESNSSNAGTGLGGSVQKSSTSHHHKETKCLSPNKKLSMGLGSTNSSVTSGGDRPKSPPTRPLSNNQYTSKTKNNNNLLLPGSFADLIAATSTEKKVFDVNSADVASSLFGMKDLSSTTKLSSSPVKLSPGSSPHLFSKTSKPAVGGAKSLSGTTGSKTINSNSSSPDILASSANKPSTSKSNSNQQPAELPRHMTQKRFISPANSKVLNKEKVIFASAPYVNPMNAEQPRSSNQPYPWQTPTHHQPQPPPSQPPPHHLPNQNAAPTTYSPILHQPTAGIHQQPIVHAGHVPKKEPPTYPAPSPLPPPQASLNGAPKTTTAGTLESQQPLNQQAHRFVGGERLHDLQSQQQDTHLQHPHHHHHQAANERFASSGGEFVASQPVREQKKLVDRDCTQRQQTIGAGDNDDTGKGSIIVQSNYSTERKPQPSDSQRQTSFDSAGFRKTEAVIVNFSENEKQQAGQASNRLPTLGANDSAQAAQVSEKKTTQPRGPPKKSKEARQAAMELSAAAVAPTIAPAAKPTQVLTAATAATPPTVTTMPKQVIECAPSGKPTLAPTLAAPLHQAPAPAAATAAATTSKPKIKRSKKHKDSPKPTAHDTATASPGAQVPPQQPTLGSVTSAQPLANVPATSQLRPSIICGLVRPQPVSTNAPVMAPVSGSPKITNPQPSYLISQPLFSFPQMPTLSAAQFQQLQQHHHQNQSASHLNQAQQQQQRPMNLLTNPISTPLGALPGLQQGARIVWATSQRLAQPAGGAASSPGTGVRMLAPTAMLPLAAGSPGAPGSTSVSAANKLALPVGSLVNRLPQPADNAALLSLATTALSTAAMTSPSPTLTNLGTNNCLPTAAASPQQQQQQALMMSAAAAAANQQAAAMFAGQQFFRPYVQRMPMAHFVTRPGGLPGAPTATTAATTAAGQHQYPLHQPTTGQIVYARLPPNHSQPRYLITQPGFMQQRFQAPHIVTSQAPPPTLPFVTLKPPADSAKVSSIKTKKVKTS